MEVKTITIPYTTPDEFHIYLIGDEHGGTKHCASDALQKQINIVKNDPLGRWVGMGDKGEFISPSDPRWDTGVIEDWVHPDNIALDQSNWYCDMFSPIASKCDGLLEGNHEDAIRTHSHIDVHNYICDKLGVANLGYSCFLRYLFHRKKSNEAHQFTGFFTHGSGWAITKGAKLNRLQRIMDSFEADMYATGHMHDIITDTKSYLTLDANNIIKQREKVGAVTGCWFRTYSQGVRASYGEKKNYPPTIIGSPMFTITPQKYKVTVEG